MGAIRLLFLVGTSFVASGALALSPPTNVQGMALGPTSVQVTWQDNSSDETGQFVERAESGSGTWSVVSGPLPENQQTFTDTGALVPLDEGTSSVYRVRACKAQCNNNNTRKVSAPSPDVVTPLFPPTNASALFGPPQQVQLSWTDVSLRNTAYTVERKATVDAGWQVLTSTLAATATSYTDAAPLDGRSYTYRVTATRTSPTASSSGALASVTTPWNDPTALSAALDDQARPVLTWQDHSTGELVYVVERRNDLAVYDCAPTYQRGDGWCEVAQSPPNPSGGTTTYVDTSLRIDPSDPAEYQYRVHASAGGSVSADTSAWSPSCSGATPADPLLDWTNARTANQSPIWPLAFPAPSDTTVVSAAKLAGPSTWAQCNDGGIPAGCNWQACTLGDPGCPELILLSNSRYVALFHARGALLGLTHRLHGDDFIHPSDPLTDSPHGWQVEFGSATHKLGTGTSFFSRSSTTPNPAISVDTTGGVTLRFTWTGIPNVNATITNSWRLDAVGSSGLRGRMQVSGTASAGIPLHARFPQLTQVTKAWTDADSFVPERGSGSLVTNLAQDTADLLTPAWQSQYVGFSRGDAGLYLAAEDPAHHPKRYNFTKTWAFEFVVYPEAVVPPASNELAMDYDVVLAPMCVEGRVHAPTRIAKRYRRFMLASDWLKRPGDVTPVRLVDRTDIPARVRDGMFWWVYFLRKFTTYRDGLQWDADGNNPRLVGINPYLPAPGCGYCQIVEHHDGSTVTPYRLVYKDVSTGELYVYPGDSGIPGTPAQRVYFDPDSDPSWVLVGGRQLADLFEMDAEETRDVFVFEAKKWACFLRNGGSHAVGFHVYTWHTPGFAIGPPVHDMVPGFDLGIDALESADPSPWSYQDYDCGPTAADDHFILPYVLSGWGDVSATYPGPNPNLAYDQSALVLPMAMHLESGQHWCSPGSADCLLMNSPKQTLARMSAGVPEWRQIMAGIAADVFGPVGARGIYLDTYGGGFDLNATDAQGSGLPRDHEPGRGLWHTTGERAVGDLVRQQKPNGVGVVAQEHATEAYFANVDLNTVYQTPLKSDIPLMQAVYGGYRMFSGPPALDIASESVTAYAMKLAGSFLMGNQLSGGNSTPFSPPNQFHLISAAGEERLAYARHLARARLDLKCYLAYGELLGASDPELSVPPADDVTETWLATGGGSQSVTQPAIRGARWTSSVGGGCGAGRAIVLTNTSPDPQQAHIPVPSNWAGTTPDLCLSDDTGCFAVALEPAAAGGWQTETLTVPAREVRYLRFGP